MTRREDSDLSGVESRQVRLLAETGSIIRVARGIFDRTSVERYRIVHSSRRTRTWAEHTAWGAIALLSNVASLDLGNVQRTRLRAALHEIVDPTELAIRLRERAVITVWSGHRSVVQRIRAELVVPDRRRLGLVEDDAVVGGCVHADDAPGLVRRYRLIEDPAGPIVLRVTRTDTDFVRDLATSNRTLSAVDAATSLDPRERGVGERGLLNSLERFRENSRS